MIEYDVTDELKSTMQRLFNEVKSITIANRRYYAAKDVLKVLGLTNTTRSLAAIHNNTHNPHYMKLLVSGICRRTPIYMITTEGILQLIMNGRSEVCTSIKSYLASKHLKRVLHSLTKP